MTPFLRALTLTSIFCVASQSAMALAVVAPGPEIGDGVVGVAVATVSLFGFIMFRRLKKSQQAK